MLAKIIYAGIGILVGAPIGFFIAALVSAAHRDDLDE